MDLERRYNHIKYNLKRDWNSLSDWKKAWNLFFVSFVSLATVGLLTINGSFNLKSVFYLPQGSLSVFSDVIIASIGITSLYIASKKFLFEKRHNVLQKPVSIRNAENTGRLMDAQGKVLVNYGNNPVYFQEIRYFYLKYDFQEKKFLLTKMWRMPREVVDSAEVSDTYDLGQGYLIYSIEAVEVTYSDNKTENIIEPPILSHTSLRVYDDTESEYITLAPSLKDKDTLGDKLHKLYQAYRKNPTPSDVEFTLDELRQKSVSDILAKGYSEVELGYKEE